MKKAIIVGGSRGIGKELARLLVDDDWKVAITGTSIDKLREVQAYNTERIIYSSFDVTELHNDVHLDHLVNKLGGLDLLIISAGRGQVNPDLDFKVEKELIDLNVAAFTQVIDWAYTYFRNKKKGQIVGITSIAGMRGIRLSPAYASSKSYQIKYLESLRQKSIKEKSGIVITEVRPGFVDTKKLEVKPFWLSSPQKAAKQIFRALLKERKVAYISKRWRLIGTFLKFLPRFLYDRL